MERKSDGHQMKELVFQFAHEADEPGIRRLLRECGLPDEDFALHLKNFLTLRQENEIFGCVGLELYNRIALLRSLAVSESLRGQGFGQNLTEEIVTFAKHMGVKDLYLLTSTAERFFAKRGFTNFPRENAPEKIRNTVEFTTLCSSTAILMLRTL